MNLGHKLEIQDLRVSFGRKQVLNGITLNVRANEVLGVIGPAQSGKSTLLKCINRTIDDIPGAAVGGSIKVDGEDIWRALGWPDPAVVPLADTDVFLTQARLLRAA